MVRSRSSFELEGAIATAASLDQGDPGKGRHFAGVKLVSFKQAAPAPATLPPQGEALGAAQTTRAALPPGVPSTHPSIEDTHAGPDAEGPAPGPPKLPDLSAVVSPIVRCEKIVDWIAEATGASDVFLADGAGLPLAGAIHDAEARIAGAGVVAASVGSLAGTLPSNSPLFEVHVGEGPFFQLIGFQAGATVYVVGLTRATPLTPRQAHAVRLACRHALGETLGGRA